MNCEQCGEHAVECERHLIERLTQERDEAKAEVERLKADNSVKGDYWSFAAALQDVAERQREACANYLHVWRYDPSKGARSWDECDAVRATPLVTDGDK